MAGSLTLGGMVTGTTSGQLIYGPSTLAGKRPIGDAVEVTLEANVDSAVKIPSEAQGFAVFFQGPSTTEVKIGSNSVTTTNGFPVAAQGWFGGTLISSLTELKFKATSPPSAFTVVFV